VRCEESHQMLVKVKLLQLELMNRHQTDSLLQVLV
jgi:hypothetical protein